MCSWTVCMAWLLDMRMVIESYLVCTELNARLIFSSGIVAWWCNKSDRGRNASVMARPYGDANAPTRHAAGGWRYTRNGARVWSMATCGKENCM
jgi:hypothetical protein